MADKDDKYSSPLMQFTVDALKKDKKAAFADVRDAAKKKGLTLYPISYGRAKALLGLVKTSKRGTGRFARAKAAAAGGEVKRGPGRPRKDGSPPMKRGPGRPRKDSYATSFAPKRGPGRPRKAVDPMDTLNSLVSAMRQGASSAETYRRTLEKVYEVVGSALRG